ncbi:MAG TPA: alpha-glucan family phosphorylase [Gaiellaceae bacterium]|jgi:starch phosphorylase|nr:alpha-glucan family phosphorylase [Gaiellaceae bacterium]
MSQFDNLVSLRGTLQRIAENLWFSWLPGARALFAELDSARFGELGDNPTALLAELDDARLAEALASASLVERAEQVLGELDTETARSTWWQGRREDDRFSVAYFSTEFGLDESLPIYSGGLGILAGDHLKSASDLGIPLVAVGLFYREGYFRQQLDESDWQGERYPENDPSLLPMRAEDARVTIELADEDGALVPVHARVWRVQVGRIPLYLLDTKVDENPDWAQRITDRLYGGDRRHRLRQELVLGVGGVRALRALGLDPAVFHMNEGHSAFLQLERLRELVEDAGLTRDAAAERLRASTVFTTHTPVPAGNEIFDAWLVEQNVGALVQRCGYAWEEFVALGRTGVSEAFGLTPFALRTSSYANGVSALHGEVSREMWHGLWPERSIDDVPIGSVTNGVHARSWIADELDRLLGTEDDTGTPDFARAYELTADDLWRAHTAAKARLLEGLAGRNGTHFDAEVLTIGFARRFATYKRADLLFSDGDRLERLLRDAERPIQIVLAGKAHPADEGGKALIQKLARFVHDERFSGRVAFIEDYEISIARLLVQGVDVWLNNPRRPLEASGTSGMKAALNGVVNCSILDGWWCEGYSPDTGFAIGGTIAADDAAQDAADASALYEVLEREVIPAYYDRSRWLDLMRNSIAQLGGRFNTNRMLIEYVETMYIPAYHDLLSRLQTA